jgi:hypothetical protein
MTDQELARERAVRELARRLRSIAPDGLLVDIDGFATTFINDMTVRGGWRHVPRPPVIAPATDSVPADKYADDLDAVRKTLKAASDKHHRKDAPHA